MDRFAPLTSVGLAALLPAMLAACADPLEPTAQPDAVAAVWGPERAHTAGGDGVLTEPAYYSGELVTFLLPAAGSRTENVQVVADCFRVGPRVPESVPIGGTVWVLTVPGAWQETTCSTDGRDAGELAHNHVFSVAPGDPEYNGKFRIVVVDDGPNYPGAASVDQYNSAAAVLAGLAAGELVEVGEVARVNWSVQRHP
jgi:hypothetical protein